MGIHKSHEEQNNLNLRKQGVKKLNSGIKKLRKRGNWIICAKRKNGGISKIINYKTELEELLRKTEEPNKTHKVKRISDLCDNSNFWSARNKGSESSHGNCPPHS